MMQHYLLLSTTLFAIGVYGVASRRNLLVTLMSIEIMLAAGSLAILAFARSFQGEAGYDGQVLVLFNMAVAAAEAAVGLALVIGLYRSLGSVDGDRADTMRG